MAANNTTRSQAQIEADLAATRSRLTDSVESLVDEVHPQRVKQRLTDDVKQTVQSQKDKLRARLRSETDTAKQLARRKLDDGKALVFTARGDLRTGRVAAAGGALAGVVGLVVLLRWLIARRRGH